MDIPEIGQQVYHLPSQQYFDVVKRTRYKDGLIKLNGQYLLEECVDPKNAPLNDSELETVVLMVRLMIESSEFEFDLLSVLGDTQRRQLWDSLTPEEREAMKTAKKEAA